MELTLRVCIVVSVVTFFIVGVHLKKFSEEDCEVCVKVIKKFEAESLDDDLRKDTKKIENKFREFCKHLTGPEERFCYFIGGSETSATSILPQMSKPLTFHMPAVKICEKLKSSDSQICDLKYEKQIDFTQVDFKKLKVKDLKKILASWNEEKACKGCSEKSEFIRVVKQLLPKYAPEAAQVLKERDEL